MRRFVVVGHKAASSGDFKLDDMAGGAGRLDILLRCVNTSLFLSHSIRRDSKNTTWSCRAVRTLPGH